MNKSILLWMIAMLMLSVGMTGCSSSDDDGIDFESLDDNHKNIIGEWQLMYYEGGHDNHMQLDPGDVTLTFTDKAVKIKGYVDNENVHYSFPLRSGNYKYYFKDVTYGKKKELTTYLVAGVGDNPDNFVWWYYFSFENGWLILTDDAYPYSGMPYTYKLKKVE